MSQSPISYSVSAGFIAAIMLLFATPVFAADTPSVASFTASPSSLSNAYSLSLSWNITNGGGASLLFTCPPGITLVNQSGGSVTCGSRIYISSASTDSAGYTVYNISGGTKVLTITLYPKNLSGTDVDSSSVQTTVSVGTAAQLISDASVSTSSVPSGSTTTFTWSGLYTTGVNFKFECRTGVQVTTPDSSISLPCDVNALSSDAPQSGSKQFIFTNASADPISLGVQVLPASGGGSYDATRGSYFTVTVQGKTAGVTPTATNFTGSTSLVDHGGTITYTWNSANASGVNIQFTCPPSLSLASTTGERLFCGSPAFAGFLPTQGSVSVTVLNADTVRGSLKASLLLRRDDGTYIIGPEFSTSVRVSVEKASSQTPAIPPVVLQSSQTQAPTQTKKASPITAALSRGSRGAQVVALQTFLAQDAAIYPEKVINGTYGPATEMAVKRFQKRHSIAKEGSTGFGSVGPATRAKINALVKP